MHSKEPINTLRSRFSLIALILLIGGKGWVTPGFLEIAKGNDEVEFGRSVRLDLNDEIVKISKSGEGTAVYFR